jgi:beta-aspartyl-peptidase (threonine type)
MDKKIAIAIHGGAGTIGKERMTEELRAAYEQELKMALDAGSGILKMGGSSLDAVEAAVIRLEDCSFFNAGKGSVFNADGGHEMDAAIMDGRTLASGAVACITQVKNPVRLARKILEKGDHVMLCGEKAVRFAREEDLPLETADYFHTPHRFEEWKRRNEEGNQAVPEKFGTVGAVALDSDGHLAAATSTGGLTGKRYGRIGDSCIIGAGTYACDETCAISCTGRGEAFIKAVAAYDIACLVAYQAMPLRIACEKVLHGKIAALGATGGLIALHRSGSIEMPFTTEGMYRACYRTNGTIEVKIF